MTTNDLIARFSSSSESQQIKFLSRLAAELTIFARETYLAGTDDVSEPQRLRLFNELQHRVAWHLVHMLDQNPNRYPADVFAGILVERAAELRCTRALLKVFEQSEEGQTIRASA
jgi:hypothetical protein